MVSNVDLEVKDRVIHLLSAHPEGLDISAITKELSKDIRDVKPILVELQDSNKIASGLKKSKGKKITSFDRHYFFL